MGSWKPPVGHDSCLQIERVSRSLCVTLHHCLFYTATLNRLSSVGDERRSLGGRVALNGLAVVIWVQKIL